MSWETLLVLVFLALPIIQGILEQRKAPPAPPPPPAPEPGTREWEEWLAASGQRRRVDPSTRQRPAEPLPAAGERPLPERRPRPVPQERAAPETVSLEMAPARPREVKVRLDDLTPDREAEHERFHRRLAATAMTPAQRAESRLRLRGAGELRRAVLLAEVLGPPRAMRPLEEDR